MNLIEICKLTEEEARGYIEKILWPNGIPVCPHCGHKGGWAINGESHRDGLYKCTVTACRKPFTVTVGTVMESSHITIRQWVIAFHLMCSSKKGISALQLKRELGLGSYQSAWHLAHRIRLAMNEDPMLNLLSGTVEVDETYVGGKPRKGNAGSPDKPKSKRGRGASNKVAVLALVERNGRPVSKPIERADTKTLEGAIKEVVHKDSEIMTDEWAGYRTIGRDFTGGHWTVNHGIGKFQRERISTNTVESYFNLLKRVIHGAFHRVSKIHLHRYCDEFSFRWNHRKINDGERTVEAIKGGNIKRLMYRQTKENNYDQDKGTA
ncbi:MAG: IS1595 family transposase [Desulfobaccales bacterium]